MERLSEFWHWVQKVTGIFLLVCLSLYGLRCIMAGQFMSFDQFEHFFRGLVRYIFG
jgi:hypothetical protein